MTVTESPGLLNQAALLSVSTVDQAPAVTPKPHLLEIIASTQYPQVIVNVVGTCLHTVRKDEPPCLLQRIPAKTSLGESGSLEIKPHKYTDVSFDLQKYTGVIADPLFFAPDSSRGCNLHSDDVDSSSSS